MSRTATIERFAAGLEGDLDVIADPYPILHELRESDPVLRVDGHGVFAFRYDDMEALLPARGGLKRGDRGGPRYPQNASPDHRLRSEELRHWAATWLVESDGQRHDRLRGLVRRAFTPRAVSKLRGQIQGVVDELLDDMSGRGRLDWADEFAFALPLAVICDLIDVDVQDREAVRDWSRAYGLALRGNGPYELVRPAYDGMMALREYMTRVVAERRESGTDSAILQALFDAEQDGEALTGDELVTMMVHLFFGGHDTTANLLASGMHTLMAERTQWERLVADPSLAAAAGEELLRYHPSVMVLERLFPEPWELRGVEIGAEEPIVLVLGAGNHDPAAFPDPDTLTIGRQGPKHLSFGLGPHFCLGAFLNRLEVEVALDTVARRFPYARLTEDPGAVEWWPSFHLRGVRSVPVDLGEDRK